VNAPDSSEATRLVRELWQRVDNGYCDSCTFDACDALAVVWPEIPWRQVAREIMDEGYES
jgi:hypothetical protein